MEDMVALRDECLACRRCAVGGCMVDGKFLSNVFSSGNRSAKLMVVGQNPGRDEAERAEPFVGASGRFFDESLASVGMSRSDFYVSNAIRCYTPGNRKPLQEELDNCRYFLDKEMAILRPFMVVALGGSALRQLTGMSGIWKNHGKTLFSPRYRTFVFPMLHPSPLNMGGEEGRAAFLEDLKGLRKAVDDVVSARVKEGLVG